MKQSENLYIIDSSIREKLPEKPGVYQFLDKSGRILYIGKAKNIKNRIFQYLALTDSRPMVTKLMEKAAFLQIVLTTLESEALVLESSLIKQKRPLFNIDLKDDKSYPFLAVTDELWPRLIVTRKPRRKYRYIRGPFTNTGFIRSLKKLLQVIHPLKYCSRTNPTGCINSQIGICPAPCKKGTDKEKYMENVNHVIDILKGKRWKELSGVLKSMLEDAAEVLNFEKAVDLRDALAILPDIRKRFGVEFSGHGVNDFFLFEKYGNTVITVCARFSDGKLRTLRTVPMTIIFDDMKSCVAAGVASFYGGMTLPEKIGIIPNLLNSNELGSILNDNVRPIAKIPVPIKKILETNLEQGVINYAKDNERTDLFLSELSKFTGTEVSSIMCIDISTFGGKNTVAGTIWWENGKFVKKNYRKFKIKTIEGVDDFGSLAEVANRLKKNWDEGKFSPPSLLLIDGGKGQISSVAGVLGNKITIAGIVKDRKKKKGHEILINSNGTERTVLNSFFDLKVKSIRDESHRFSITFNRSLRKKSITTGLTQIKGIGKAKELALLDFFKSIEGIKNTEIEQLEKCPGISLKNARNVYRFFN